MRPSEAQVVLGCGDRLPQASDFIGEGMQVGQGVFDVAIGDENLIRVSGNGLPVACLGRVEIGPEPAPLKDWNRDTGKDGPDAALPVENGRDVGALESRGARQHEAGIELRRRHADLGIGRHEILLRLGDVRPARQELGGQARRYGGRRHLAQRIDGDREGRSGTAAQNRQCMLLVGTGSEYVPLLGQGGLKLGLCLRHDDRAHEPGPELNGKETDLLPIGADGLLQDLRLGIQGPEGVVETGHIRLHKEADHPNVILACLGLGPR